MWYTDVVSLLTVIKAKLTPTLWQKEPRFKYLNFRVDTRDGSFTITDRNGEEVTPEQLFGAM